MLKYDPEELLASARGMTERLQSLRRDFHRHPELGFEEFQTTARIREELAALPRMRLRDLNMKTGAAAEIAGEKGGKTVALRCDIDALLITEKNTHSYVSETPGKMHACGHDGHIAILLGAAALIAKFAPDCNVRFLFQPAEESTPDGALPFLAEGVLDGADAAFGFHLNATSDFGKIGWHDGPVMAGGTAMRVTVRGKSGHPAYPEACVNPILILQKIVAELEDMRGTLRATRPCFFTPSHIHAGYAFQPMTPAEATLTARLGFLEKSVDTFLRERANAIVQSVTALHGAAGEVEFHDMLPLTDNAPELGKMIRAQIAAFGLPSEEIFPSMGSDDFGYYAQKVPSYYMTFGIRKGADFPLAHTENFDFDDTILADAAAFFAACALEKMP